MSLILYGYWRSSAAYRVRIALNIKQLVYESRAVHLSREGGEQHHAEFHRLNPSELIPVLIDGELCLNQSLAIIEYLDETIPPPFDPRARCRALSGESVSVRHRSGYPSDQ